MSLINDALKKAQNLQTRPSGATSTFPRATTPASPVSAPESTPQANAAMPARTGKSPHSALIIGVAATVLLVGLGAIGYVAYALFFAGSPEDQAVTSAAAPGSVKPAEPLAADSATPPPAAKAPSVTAAAPVATLAPAPAPVAPSATTAPSPAAAPAATPAVATSTSSPAAPPAPAPVEEVIEEWVNSPKPHIQAWVDKITVSGIRPGDRPKALMNDRVYLVGDMVNRELGLQLSKISDRLLVFEDAEGNTYEYTF